MKKLLAISLLAAMMCSSCSSKSEQSSSTAVITADTEALANAAYKKRPLPLPEDLNMIYTMEGYNSGNDNFIIGSGEESPEFWHASGNLDSWEKIVVNDFDIGTVYNAASDGSGNFCEFLVHADYGDLPEPDLSSPDHDMELYDEAAEYSFMIKVYSAAGELVSENTLEDFPAEPGMKTYLGEAAFDGDYLMISVDNEYYVISADGQKISQPVLTGDEKIEETGRDSSGAIVCAVNMGDDKVKFRRLVDGELESSGAEVSVSETIQGISCGNEEYSMFVNTRSTIYGLNSENDEMQPLFSINASGANFNEITGFVSDNGVFAVVQSSYTSFKTRVYWYDPCSPEELENIPVITVGVDGDSMQRTLSEETELFYETAPDFQVKFKVYGDYSEDGREKAQESFERDAVSGELPDVFAMNRSGDFCGIDMIGKSAFVDLDQFIDGDSEVNRQNILPQALDFMEIDGEIPVITNAFTLKLNKIAKEKFVKNINQWNLDTYIDLLESPPEGVMVEGFFRWNENDTKLLRTNTVYWAKWADFKEGVCHFDEPDFLHYLNYCNGAEVYDIESEWREPTEEEAAEDYYMQQNQYREDKVMFATEHIGMFREYLNVFKGEFGGEPVKIMGEPVGVKAPVTIENGFHCFGISKSSENKDLAWQYLRWWCSDDFYKTHKSSQRQVYGFPITESGMKIAAEFEKLPQDNQYCKGEENYTGYLYSLGIDGGYDELGYVDDEVIAGVRELISQSVYDDSGSYAFYPGSEFYSIGDEEMQRFLKGGCTAEECADVMQSRLSIYLSERS